MNGLTEGLEYIQVLAIAEVNGGRSFRGAERGGMAEGGGASLGVGGGRRSPARGDGVRSEVIGFGRE